ncbi:hypothetical protein AB4Y43_01250 [Paraburkholderia sp. BR10872]|uniref:hypothetical protein n=1 Tax=Paraburkholderia sp. BR10872 TaxID=3236989 RepID=UPI0034D23DBF
MKPKRDLVEMLRAVYDKYEDDDIAKCVIRAVEVRDELRRTRWDLAREWTLCAVIVLWILNIVIKEVPKWL